MRPSRWRAAPAPLLWVQPYVLGRSLNIRLHGEQI